MTAIVFPGQGSQFLSMSKDFYDNFPLAKEVFNNVSEATKIDIKDIIFNNPSNLINQTQYTQLAIFCSSMAIFEVLNDIIDLDSLKISCMMGHSLGEYTALTASNNLSIEDCSILLKKRGELMQNAYESNKSGMAAIIGFNCNDVENLIKVNNLDIEIANDNSPHQIVISGIKEILLDSKDYFLKKGAKKFILLNVSAAFHSRLMLPAELKLKEFILKTNFIKSKIPIISNYNAKLSNDTQVIIDNLIKQMSSRVRWVESINLLESMKESNIIEIGPGKVLTALIKRISSSFEIINIENISDLKKL